MLSILTWPFRMIWMFIGFLFGMTGRILSLVVGFAIMAAGIALTVTFIGAVVGIPLIVMGFLMMIRSVVP